MLRGLGLDAVPDFLIEHVAAHALSVESRAIRRAAEACDVVAWNRPADDIINKRPRDVYRSGACMAAWKVRALDPLRAEAGHVG